MMKFSKTLLVVLGVVASLAFVGLMLYVVIQVNQLHAVAIANRSAGFANPRNWMLIAAGLGFLGGLLLGMGLALPDKTFKARDAELRRAEDQLAAREASAETPQPQTDQHTADPRTDQDPR
ncbi:MAG: hypothetical protein WBL05_10215 [Brooklawnia sp.]|uniref:hypothetical protein n=1 Tax=Brooklawnia sp. TaxID=2699740 RepID=UPI003C72B834